MEYRVVRGGDEEELERKVQKLIDKGWRPLGGICAAGGLGQPQTGLYQSLTRDEDDEPRPPSRARGERD
ncbi:MAG: DUF1737 domain-containing protein [Gemmataceae bacterium]|nr:DUF1737 domain-containing protein [Gemmataceae bacterium]